MLYEFLSTDQNLGIYLPPALRALKESPQQRSTDLPQPPSQLSSNDHSDTKSKDCWDSSEPLSTATANTPSLTATTNNHHNNSNNKQRTRERRPDRAVYVPRARRSQTTPPATVSTKVNSKEPPQSAACLSPVSPPQQSSPFTNENFTVQNCCDPLLLVTSTATATASAKASANSDATAIHIQPSDSVTSESNHNCNRKTSVPNNCVQAISSEINSVKMAPKKGVLKIENYAPKISNTNVNKKDDGEKEEKELRKASQEMNRASKRIIKQTFNSNVLEIEPEIQNNKSATNNKCEKKEKIVNPEEDDWESMFDDNGDCLDPKMLDELTAQVGKVTIEKPKTDYKVMR